MSDIVIDLTKVEKELKRRNDLKILELRMRLHELKVDNKFETKEHKSFSNKLDSLK